MGSHGRRPPKSATRRDAEWQVQIRTAADRLPALVEYLRTRLGDDVPEIIASQIVRRRPDHLSWVDEQTRS
ncbi:divalent cation tolerance protein CutA [Saccharopolyspora thermophila]|uniref:Uncharacterized protein n=1 Tax=Saccharopolyspora thermophila TaxID=89367 RepID=A0ABN1D517_9PSEU